MASYQLHYAGCTFDLPGREDAEAVIKLVESVQARDAGSRHEIVLSGGVRLQLFVSRATQIAFSARP